MSDLAPLINDYIRTISEVGTFSLALIAVLRVGKVATKLDDNHKLTTVLVHQTNDLTEKLMEKTETLAEARGVEKGVAQQIASTVEGTAANLVAVTAEAAAKVLDTAAKQAAATLAAAVISVDAAHTPQEGP